MHGGHTEPDYRRMKEPRMAKNQLNSCFSHSRPNRLNLLALAMGFAIVGCGEKGTETPADAPTQTSAVAPSEPQTVTEGAAATDSGKSQQASEAPGSLELPPGDLPAAEPNSPSPKGSGGMEMPDVQVSRKPPLQSSAESAASEVVYGSLQEVQDRVAKTGKVTIVDFWSLSCQPCLEEFPGLVRLQKQFPAKVQCFSVDIDFDGRKSRPPKYYEERVAAFVSSVGATFPNYISSTPSDEIYAKLELDSIPAVLIYDAEGKLVKKFVDAGDTAGFSYDDDVIPFVKQMME